jgi:hypothetical protein
MFKKKFIFMQISSLDTCDLVSMIEKIYGFKTKHSPYFYYLVSDNNMDYVHYPDIPDYLFTELNIELKKYNI